MGDGAAGAIERIEALGSALDFNALTLAVLDLTDAQRRAVVTWLRSSVRSRTLYEIPAIHDSIAAIIGAGVLPDSKSMATWLGKHGMRHYRQVGQGYEQHMAPVSLVPNVFYLLTERGVPWLADVAVQLAERMPRSALGEDRVELVCRIVEHTGQPVPTSPGFVAGWVRAVGVRGIAAAITEHPAYGALLAHLFDADEVGAEFDHDPRWPVAVAGLVAGGVGDRATVLDACLARLARGGKPGASRAFLSVLQALAPSLDDVATRTASYLSVLAADSSIVAGYAQTTLITADERGLLPAADRLQLARVGLARPEKKLARAQLSQVAKCARADRGAAADYAEQILASWANADADIVRRGIRVVADMKLGADDRARLAAQLRAPLAVDLEAELAAVLGVAPVGRRPGSATLPATARTPLDLRLELDDLRSAALSAVWDSRSVTTPLLETIIDGLLRWSATDRTRLRAAFTPDLESERFTWLSSPDRGYGPRTTMTYALYTLIQAAIGGTPTRPAERDPYANLSGGGMVLVERIYRLALSALPPESIALPTWTNGLIDPEAFLDRLQRAASEGWHPPALELEQALLRLDLPGGADERGAMSTALATIGTDAARVARRWIEEALPSEVTIKRSIDRRQHVDYRGEVTRDTVLVGSAIDPPHDLSWSEGIWSGLVVTPAGSYPLSEYYVSPLCLPAIAPRHRDVIAAHCVLPLAGMMHASTRLCEILPVLAEVDGAIGKPTLMALAYGLANTRAEQRAFAENALAIMCARSEWDGALFGDVLGDLCGQRSVVLKRLVAPLGAVVAAGGSSALEPTLRVLVSALLTSDDMQPGLPDVLDLAVDVAHEVAEPGPITGLADFAARRGSSRQLVAARRLLDALSR